jgi:hypothetical protein
MQGAGEGLQGEDLTKACIHKKQDEQRHNKISAHNGIRV